MKKLIHWTFPTQIHFGAGALTLLPKLCKQLSMKSPLIVTDKGLLKLPFIMEILIECKKHTTSAALFGDVQGNPKGADVEKAIETFRKYQCDSVIAVGGGSAMDVAKAVALAAGQQQDFWQLGGSTQDWSHLRDDDVYPIIAIPTTAGTGSEVGRSTVITHEPTQTKVLVWHSALMPKAVISDPELTLGLPPHITAATGIDAFVHCLEAYCAPGFHPMAEGIALEGMRLISEALPRAFDNGQDVEARGQMLIAASMGAVAFQKDLGAVHALAHQVGALYDLHHGLANAIILPYVLLANRPAIEERIRLPARVLNLEEPDFDGFLRWVLAFRKRLEIPHTLEEAGIPAENIQQIGERAAGDPCAPSNPIQFTPAQYADIYRKALTGIIE